MLEYFSSIPDAFKIPLLTSVLTVMALLLKDYMTNRKNLKKEKLGKIETFKIYSNPIVKSASSLFWRLKEVFENRYSYLQSDAPKNKFNTYKYISTVYRVFNLIAWVRAIEKELSYYKFGNQEKHKEIEKAIHKFKASLADGGHVEKDRISNICKHWNVDSEKYSRDKLHRLWLKIEKIIWNNILNEKVLKAIDLKEETKKNLTNKIADLVSVDLSIEPIDKGIVAETTNKIMKEVSRIECWIYRDWQQAIGDFMLIKLKESYRKYNTMGFKEFEELFEIKNNDTRGKWIKRMESLFVDIDFSIDNRFDARIQQLKNMCSACLEIIEVFNDLEPTVQLIEKSTIEKMRTFDVQNNMQYYRTN